MWTKKLYYDKNERIRLRLPRHVIAEWGYPSHVTIRVSKGFSLTVQPGAGDGVVRQIHGDYSINLPPAITRLLWPRKASKAVINSVDGMLSITPLADGWSPEKVLIRQERLRKYRGLLILPVAGITLYKALWPGSRYASFTFTDQGFAKISMTDTRPVKGFSVKLKWLEFLGKAYSVAITIPRQLLVIWPSNASSATVYLLSDLDLLIDPLSIENEEKEKVSSTTSY
ncbi:MAG: hypothetical protein ACP5IE_00060 [Infirmifilum sp.]